MSRKKLDDENDRRRKEAERLKVKAENGKPAPMSETESSLSRFTANAAGVQSHEVGLNVKGESGKPAPMSETESSLSRFTATTRTSVVCDDGSFSSPKECDKVASKPGFNHTKWD